MCKAHNSKRWIASACTRKLHLLALRIGDIQKKTTLRGVAGWDATPCDRCKNTRRFLLWAGALLLVNQLLQQAADELCIAMSKLPLHVAESCETYLLDLWPDFIRTLQKYCQLHLKYFTVEKQSGLNILHPWSLTFRPWKMVVGRRLYPTPSQSQGVIADNSTSDLEGPTFFWLGVIVTQ